MFLSGHWFYASAVAWRISANQYFIYRINDMTKWEYKFLNAADLERRGFFKNLEPDQVEEYFNSLGEEGWEIINVDFTDTTSFIDFRGVARRPK